MPGLYRGICYLLREKGSARVGGDGISCCESRQTRCVKAATIYGSCTDAEASADASPVGYDQFLQILNRPDGWKPAGTAGTYDLTSPSPRRPMTPTLFLTPLPIPLLLLSPC
jgi:hypothetical protein